MIEIKGKYTNAVVFASDVEESATEQIQTLCDQPFAEGSKIRVMPDVHAGTGCTIGTTLTITDKVVPNLVGVDIGCGMLTIPLGKIEIDLPKFDQQVKRSVPAGAGAYHNEAKYGFAYMFELKCFKQIKTENVGRMTGTLGGGNHFIELDMDNDGNVYLVIHSGSRNLGLQVCNHYQQLAIDNYRKDKPEIAAIVERCKAEGRSRDIESELKAWHRNHPGIPPQLCYLEDHDKDDYLHDMKICQAYALYNRWAIANEILKHYFYQLDVKLTSSHKLKVKGKGFKISTEGFETFHNYIDTDNGIIRKGAISAQAGEKVLIPINMRDGSIIAVGKGNSDWNYSAPHGAGRLMSRSVARDTIDVQEYRESMSNVYSSTVGEGTLDEAPQAYKSIDYILENIKETVDVEKIISPIYNFKAAEDKSRRWK